MTSSRRESAISSRSTSAMPAIHRKPSEAQPHVVGKKPPDAAASGATARNASAPTIGSYQRSGSDHVRTAATAVSMVKQSPGNKIRFQVAGYHVP